MPSSPPHIPRPPSRSERLLRDTLRRDETRRTHGTHSACGDDDDDDFFQSAILSRCSSRRNSAASALCPSQPTSFYIPDQHEHASYSRLLRSSSYSGSSRSAHSDPRSSPRSAYTHEKRADFARHHDAAPHEAVLRTRLDSVMHSMRVDKDRDPVDSPTASLASSLGSLSNSRAYSHDSHQTHQTHLTVPDSDPSVSPTSRPKRVSYGAHRHTQSASVVQAQPTSPRRPSTPPCPSTQSPRHPRTQQGHPSPQTPTPGEKDQLKRLHSDSPWMYPPLPPSPDMYSTSPSKRAGPSVVAFVATPPMLEGHTHHLSACSPHRHSPISSFDPEAASHALRQLPGYVSFASVAGLGAPPEEDDRRSGRKPFAGFNVGNKGRLSGLGLGSGKWWIF